MSVFIRLLLSLDWTCFEISPWNTEALKAKFSSEWRKLSVSTDHMMNYNQLLHHEFPPLCWDNTSSSTSLQCWFSPLLWMSAVFNTWSVQESMISARFCCTCVFHAEGLLLDGRAAVWCPAEVAVWTCVFHRLWEASSDYSINPYCWAHMSPTSETCWSPYVWQAAGLCCLSRFVQTSDTKLNICLSTESVFILSALLTICVTFLHQNV